MKFKLIINFVINEKEFDYNLIKFASVIGE